MKTRNKLLLFAAALLLIRIVSTGSLGFCFLVWNLFLAWLPYRISAKLKQGTPSMAGSVICVTTILFLPNAPYIITDLFHLKQDLAAPLWLDTILILTFALAGLWYWALAMKNLLVYLSSFRLRKSIVALIRVAVVILSAYGIYLGRFLRFNSWDVVTDPGNLAGALYRSIFSYGHFKHTAVVTFVFSAFLYVIYDVYENADLNNKTISENKN